MGFGPLSRASTDPATHVLSGQNAAGEQHRANGDRGHHRADDAEPFLVGRRIRNSAVEMIAHRFPRLFAVSRARAFLCERMLARIMNGPRTLPKKQGSVAFGSQKSRRANASHASFMRLRRDFLIARS